MCERFSNCQISVLPSLTAASMRRMSMYS